MTCFSLRPMIEALVDGELDASQQLRILEHLEGCPSCSGEHERLRTLQTDVRASATYFRAPDYLRQRVIDNPCPAKVQPLHAPPARRTFAWMLFAAASVVLAISLGTNLVLLRSHRSETQLVAQEVLSGHMRSLLGSHLFDVISSDGHTVKPWFAGKLDFSPNVKDLASQGFPLSGGRVDYLAGRPVAALVFRRGQHVINLFTWPSARSENMETTQAGYNLVEWTENGMAYWAASDLNLAELKQFENLYRD